jgi:hypothetical protein
MIKWNPINTNINTKGIVGKPDNSQHYYLIKQPNGEITKETNKCNIPKTN